MKVKTRANELKDWAKRRAKVVALHQSGLSYREIGERIKPPISKQRVAKILAKELG